MHAPRRCVAVAGSERLRAFSEDRASLAKGPSRKAAEARLLPAERFFGKWALRVECSCR